MNLFQIVTSIKKLHFIVVLLLLSLSQLSYPQSEKKHLREGNSNYKDGKYSESELSYRRATELPKSSPDSWFSLGNSIYKQDRFEDAAANFEKNASMYDNSIKKSNSFYNLGNALLGAQKIDESINAYKNSLKLNPTNLQAKYNLAYAQDLLQKQKEQQQDQNQDQNQNKEEDKKEENKDSNKDQQNNDQNKQNQDQDRKENQADQKISQDDARRLLEALASDELKVQDKVQKDKANAAMVKTLKNW